MIVSVGADHPLRSAYRLAGGRTLSERRVSASLPTFDLGIPTRTIRPRPCENGWCRGVEPPVRGNAQTAWQRLSSIRESARGQPGTRSWSSRSHRMPERSPIRGRASSVKS